MEETEADTDRQTEAQSDRQWQTWHGPLITGAVSLHEAGQPTELLLQLHDCVQVGGGDGGLRAVPWQPQHVVRPRAARYGLQGVGGVTGLRVEGSFFRRQLLLVVHEGIVSLLNLAMLEVGESLGLLRLARMLGLSVDALRQ